MPKRNRRPGTLNLRPHQLEAVRSCEKYFESGSKRGCLVHMPTGTGKTGVMAVLATQRATDKPVLVVCPSAALVKQLCAEFEIDFWETIQAPAEWRPEEVVHGLPGSIETLAEQLKRNKKGRRIIVVATIQAVQQMYAADDIDKLRKHIGTILFDEGHREPAPYWAKVIRSFGVPTILFSATPFRGDLKVFDIDDKHIHFLSFKAAVDGALIRGVKIDERTLSHSPRQFARQIVKAREKLISDGVFDDTCKVIVRAGSEDTVNDLFDAFKSVLGTRGDGVLAMHVNFKESTEGNAQRRPDVPAQLRKRPEKFLIHQFMLVEGIDDPACTILAMYEPFTSTRMLVQQVGRLTRQPQNRIGKKGSPALVLAPKGDGVLKQWESFLAYDQGCIDNGGTPPIRNSEKVFKDLVAALPEQDFVDGKFRRRLDLENGDLSGDLHFPRSALVYEVGAQFNVDEFRADVSGLLDQEDRLENHVNEAGKTGWFHLSLALKQTPFLTDSLFQIPSLEVTIYALVGKRLYFYDSGGLWIDELEHVGRRIGPKELHSLLPETAADHITFLAVKNTDIGPMALRSRTLSARSLARSGVFMGEHMNVVTRATGWADKTRRSVGFSRSRVRDGDGNRITAEGFADWCVEIDSLIDQRRAGAPILNRFAEAVPAPANTTPINILIDFREVESEQFSEDEGTTPVTIEDLCVDVVRDDDPDAPGPFRFELTIAGKRQPIWMRWDRKKKKYWLISSDLSKLKAKTETKVSLTKRLNQLQAFRIITHDCRHAYVDGAFYAIELNLKDPRGAGQMVLDLITGVTDLAGITSEKGTPEGKTRKTWQSGSLFRFIDDALVEGKEPALGPTFPAFVCDDLGTEAGDFIGVDDRPAQRRAVFVVAKHKGKATAGVSASDFYDVSGQALKNLAFLKSDGEELPGAATKFDADWTMSEDKKTDRIPRRRAGPGSTAFRRLLNHAIRTPGTERAIWIVCGGGMLSKSAIEREFRSPKRKAHVLQFYNLVVSAYSACQSVGVELKIFCAE